MGSYGMKFMLVTALIFALNSPSYALEDGVVCDTVDTSTHGTLLAKRVTDGRSEILRMCIGQLRLLDPRNNVTYCLANNVDGKEEEVLECGKKTGEENKGNKTTGTGKCPEKTPMPDKVVISSTGEAATAESRTAGWLGQYEIVRDTDTIHSAEVYYIQSNSQIGKEDPKAEPSYLFPDEYCRWSVSMLPNESNSDQYRHRNPSRTVPTGTGGWKIRQVNKTMLDDPTLTVTPGPYPPLATYGFIVKVSGEAARMYNVSRGYFAKTNEWWMGRPVYKNNQGRGLMHGNLGWMIGPKPGSWEIRGLGSHQSPVDQRNWEYLIDSKPDVWDRADVEVFRN